ncbi:CBS domain-containing protein [Desulfotomaculum copahuensis]|uniref:CBS domain-containing protein n=1 Tax=Desulfotomaculum copahuensis TaxID=1838280 RepID=UPI003D05B832
MFMVGEMTGGYAMLVPAMIAMGIAYVLVGNNTIYESQVPTPADSPAHRLDYYFPLLENVKVKEIMSSNIPLVTLQTTVAEAGELLKNKKIKGLPVVAGENDRQLLGVITREDVIRVPLLQRTETGVGQTMSAPPIVIGPDETLDVALTVMSDNDIAFLPVVEENKLAGLITRRGIIRTYILAAQKAGAEHTRASQQLTA